MIQIIKIKKEIIFKLGKRMWNKELKITMAPSEYIFYKWLRNLGIKKSWIRYNNVKKSPDFEIGNTGYEVKQIKFTKTKIKKVLIEGIQFNRISKLKSKNFYVFVNEEDWEGVIVPIKQLNYSIKQIKDIRISWLLARGKQLGIIPK